MKITEIRSHVLLDPGVSVGATSSAQDALVVEVHTDQGIVGWGEADVNPWIGYACIHAPSTHTMGRSLTDLLIGEDPTDIETCWERMYTGSAMNGRRGAVIHAMGALDIALHDVRAQDRGVPMWADLGQRCKDTVLPYASLQPEVAGYQAYRDALLEQALATQALGFRAAKLSLTLSGPYAHMGMDEPYDRMTETLAVVRRALGDDFTLMVDVQYAFPDADTALGVLADWRELRPDFVETPLPADDIEGYRRLSTEQPIPIAAGEWLATRHEFSTLIHEGGIGVAQPDIGRVGGLTEAMRVAEMAAEAGVRIVPHLWKTGISVAAAIHFAVVTPHCGLIEFTPPELTDSALRRELLTTQPTLIDGRLPLPQAPGLGIEINQDALARFAASAAHAWSGQP